MNEKQARLEGEISQKASNLATLRSFTEHPGFAIFHKIMEGQKDLRKGEILYKPLQNSEALYAQEFMKGEISGLTLSQISVFAQIETLKSDLQAATFQLENERELAKEKSEADGRSRVDGPTFSD